MERLPDAVVCLGRNGEVRDGQMVGQQDVKALIKSTFIIRTSPGLSWNYGSMFIKKIIKLLFLHLYFLILTFNLADFCPLNQITCTWHALELVSARAFYGKKTQVNNYS